MDKKNLIVDKKSSEKISRWQIFYSVFGWILLIAGLILLTIGIARIIDEYDPTTLIIGGSILAISLILFFNSAILQGITVLVQNAEYNKAIVEGDYTITDKEGAAFAPQNTTPISRTTPVASVTKAESTKGAARKFSVGQHVVVKDDESQFTIDDVMDNANGGTLYYSEKLNRYFTEDELEDYREYSDRKVRESY